MCCLQQQLYPPAGAAAVNFYLNFHLRANTRKLYTTHQSTLNKICSQLAIDASRPLNEPDLCAVVACYARCHKRTTVDGFVSAVANRAHTLGHGNLPRHEMFRRLRVGIQNFHADQVSQPKRAITMADLRAIHALINHSSFEGARNWCACMLAFFGLLRINEYAAGGLKHRHAQLTPTGVAVTVPFSKTSLQPTRIELASRTDELCPARALSAYLAFFTRHPALPQRPSDSLFISRRTLSEYQDMSDTEFIAIVRDLLQRAHPLFDTTQYAGHSFRRGGTSAMKQWGASDSSIQQHGRWKSDVYRRYIDVDHNLAVRLQATLSLPSFAANRQ